MVKHLRHHFRQDFRQYLRQHLASLGSVMLLSVSAPVLAACLTDAQLATLNQQETAFLLGRIPPAFAHALEDNAITLSTTLHASATDVCSAQLTMTLPAAELAEANQILDADIAKKIMLSAQGYGLPAATTVQASYQVEPSSLAVAPADTLQTSALGHLRASVELMYATLTQARANLSEAPQNNRPWRAVFKTQHLQQCSQTMMTGTGKTNHDQTLSLACACQADGLEKAVSERQLAYLNYVKSNPYAFATGSHQTYQSLLTKLNAQCDLKNK